MSNDKKKKQKALPYQERLEAKKAQLEAKAMESQMRLQNNIAYTGKNIPAIAVQEVTDKVKETSPTVGRLFSAFGIGETKEGTRMLKTNRHGARFYDDTGDFDSEGSYARRLPNRKESKTKAILELLEEYGLPVLATVGSRKLLSMTLGGSGKLLRKGLSSGLKILFRKKK